jgi:hypothetical protein
VAADTVSASAFASTAAQSGLGLDRSSVQARWSDVHGLVREAVELIEVYLGLVGDAPDATDTQRSRPRRRGEQQRARHGDGQSCS